MAEHASRAEALIRESLESAGVSSMAVDERVFPGERWLLVHVPMEQVGLAQSLVVGLEGKLQESDDSGDEWVVAVRPIQAEVPLGERPLSRSALGAPEVDRLIQLLEARSRTSEALPSLNYVEDPRANLAAISASRHHVVYGRRGVGKTALLLESKRQAEKEGHITVWVNAHTLRHLGTHRAFVVVCQEIFRAVTVALGPSESAPVRRLRAMLEWLAGMEAGSQLSLMEAEVDQRLPELNSSLRGVLLSGVARLYVYIDDYYLYPLERQPQLLDLISGLLRDADGWLKVASIERLTRPYEPSKHLGLQIPHDASKVDLDVTLESPEAAHLFLQDILEDYTKAAGISHGPSQLAKREALGRLVLASGGVPRDYLNLFSSSIVVARSARKELAREVGKEDVAVAAGEAARGKKRDLELDVASENAPELLGLLSNLSQFVKGEGFSYFRVNVVEKQTSAYELFGRLVDLRFAHLIQASLSDQHEPGTRYEAYILDLSEWTDVRLKRGLNVLDLLAGTWMWRMTGEAGSSQQLTGTGLRDRLRRAPIVPLGELLVAPAD